MIPVTRPLNVLFLCTGNSARSIMAEALMNHIGKGKLVGYSAGSHPKGTVHPMAIALLDRMNIPTAGLHSKGWDEFAAEGAPQVDFVFTVCDDAANEVCPVWFVTTTDALRPHPDEVVDLRWVSRSDLSLAVASAPWAFSPWMVEQMSQLGGHLRARDETPVH